MKKDKKNQTSITTKAIIAVLFVCIVFLGYQEYSDRQNLNDAMQTAEAAVEDSSTPPVALALTEEETSSVSEPVSEEPTSESEEYQINHNLGDSLGLIMIPEIGIKAPITFGATDESMITSSVGLVENRNWGDSGMVMLGHSGFDDSSTLFTSLYMAEEGMVVTLKGTDGSIFTLVVSQTSQITLAEYTADYNAVVYEGDWDLTLVTCVKNAETGATDRLLVRCTEVA